MYIDGMSRVRAAKMHMSHALEYREVWQQTKTLAARMETKLRWFLIETSLAEPRMDDPNADDAHEALHYY